MKLYLFLKANSYKLKALPGFTLIEVVVSVGLFSMIAVGIVILVSQILTQSTQQSGYLADSDQSRRLGFKIMKELRNGVASSTGGFVLQSAGEQEIIFYSNVDGGTDVERLRYFAQDGKLKRGVVKPIGNPLTYDPAAETVSEVQNNLANGSTPLFYYYNGSYAGSTDTYLSQPVNVSQVTFVKLNLLVYHKGQSTGTGTYTVTAGATVRNLKTNLGN